MSESPRIVALKEDVESAARNGMPESEVMAICKAEALGAARLREAVRECLLPDKIVRLSYYDHRVDKKLTNDQIFETVNQAVKAP